MSIVTEFSATSMNEERFYPSVRRGDKQIRFWVPKSFDYRRELPPELWKFKDRAHWLLDTVGKKCAFIQTDEEGYAHLASNILKRNMGKRIYVQIRDSLVEKGWIDLSPSYSPGYYSKGFALGQSHESEDIKEIQPRDKMLIKHILQWRAIMREEESKRRLPIHYELENYLEDLSILPLYDSIMDKLAEGAKYCQKALTNFIHMRIPRFIVGDTGRCFTAFTGLKRSFRPYLRLQGLPLTGVDICCAQPALLVLLTHLKEGGFVPTYTQTLRDRLLLSCADRAWPGSGGPGLSLVLSGSAPFLGPDLDRFSELVFSGELHQYLIDLCRSGGIPLPGDAGFVVRASRRGRDVPKTPKDAVKILLMQEVLAKKGRYPSDFERLFAERFPTVHAYVRWFNSSALCHPKPRFSELIRVLQRLESFVVIEHVAPRLVKKIPILTLHDAIYCRQPDVGMVKDAFLETFAELGLRMQVKEELVCNAV